MTTSSLSRSLRLGGFALLLFLFFCCDARAESPAPPPTATPSTGYVVVEVHTDDDGVSVDDVRSHIAAELGVSVMSPEQSTESQARGIVTVTYSHERTELAVTYHDARRGTVTRVVPAPPNAGDVPRTAALLAGNLARDEAAELVSEAAPPKAVSPPSAPPPPRPQKPATTDARQPPAERPATNRANPISVAVLFGYGFNNSNSHGGDTLDIYGPGVGARAGYTFGFGMYLGASFVYHSGFTRNDLGIQPAHGRVLPFGIELGYAAKFGGFGLVPYIGAGAVSYDASYVASSTLFEKGSGLKQAIWPGLSATYDLGRFVFAGIDARYTVIFAGGDDAIVGAGHGSRNGLGLFGTFGARIPD